MPHEERIGAIIAREAHSRNNCGAQQVVRGYFAYHAVPTNFSSLSAFLHHVKRLWLRAAAAQPAPSHDVVTFQPHRGGFSAAPAHPSSLARRSLLCHSPEVEAECLNRARSALCGGRPAMGVPTAIRGEHQLRHSFGIRGRQIGCRQYGAGLRAKRAQQDGLGRVARGAIAARVAPTSIQLAAR